MDSRAIYPEMTKLCITNKHTEIIQNEYVHWNGVTGFQLEQLTQSDLDQLGGGLEKP